VGVTDPAEIKFIQVEICWELLRENAETEEEDLFHIATRHNIWLTVDASRVSSALKREQQIASFFQASN
jgi:hypothetical protein